MAAWLITHDLFESSWTVVLGDDDLTVLDRLTVLKRFKTMDIAASSLRQHMTDLGLVAKVGYSYSILDAEFVSKRFYPTKAGVVFGLKPGRTLAKIGYMLERHGVTNRVYLERMAGTIMSLYTSANHVPFLRLYVRYHMEYFNLLPVDLDTDHGREMYDLRVNVRPEVPEDMRYKILNTEAMEADENTWAAFTSLYDLDEGDEAAFGEDLMRAFRRGLPYVIDSPAVNHMVDVDFSM
jgi:hypothetical protein